MTLSRRFCLFAPALVLFQAACGGEVEQGTQPDQTNTSPASGVPTSSLAKGSLGTVHYSYDPSALTRAEVDLSIPPDFEQSVFAIKFIPTALVTNLGEQACSFGSTGEGHACSASVEVGFALALLDRPLSHYATMLDSNSPAETALEPVSVGDHEGMSIVHQTDRTNTRYTFLPAGERTLLLVDRYTDEVDDGAKALEQLRASLEF